MKKYLRLLALLLCCALLSGCIPLSGNQELKEMGLTAYSDMIYIRPDMEKLEQSLDKALEAATGSDFEAIIQSIYKFYDIYDLFYTQYPSGRRCNVDPPGNTGCRTGRRYRKICRWTG